MKKTRKNTIPVLIDIKYAHHRNHFEEIYGEHVSYTKLEQDSYLELKEMAFEMINKDIKFRKFCRDNGALTIKADMTKEEFDRLLEIHENSVVKKKKTDIFTFLFDFAISDIRVMTKSDLDRNKKTKLSAEEYQFIEDQEEKEWNDDDDDESEDGDENEDF